MDFLITGNQRSGTTAYGRLIGNLPNYYYHAEVFLPWNSDLPNNYYRYYKGKIDQDISAVVPTPGSAESLLNGFHAELSEIGKGSQQIVDIKYNQYQAIQPISHDIGTPPFLMSHLQNSNTRIMHIVRSSLFDQAISDLYAQQRGFFHSNEGDLSKRPLFSPAPQRILNMMRRAKRLTNVMRGYLKNYEHAYEIDYAYLFENNRLSQHARSITQQWLEQDLDEPMEVPLKKVTPPVHTILENADEILRFFEGTEFEEDIQKAFDV